MTPRREATLVLGFFGSVLITFAMIGAATRPTPAVQLEPAPVFVPFVPTTQPTTAPSTQPVRPVSSVTVEVWSESIEFGADYWQVEVERKYPGAVMVLCHGNTLDGEWYFFPDRLVGEEIFPGLFYEYYESLPPIKVEHGVQYLQQKYPGRTIVLLTCNPDHIVLDIPGVVYALESVWVVPDRNLHDRSTEEPEPIGNIYEFQENSI